MDISKYTKKLESIQKKNVELDMESMNRFREILEKIKDSDNAVQLDFLKEYIRLQPHNESALAELEIKMKIVGGINYRSVIDETDKKIYLLFSSLDTE